MSIDTVLLIVILTFGIGFVLNRWDLGLSRHRRRRRAEWRHASSTLGSGVRKHLG